MLEFAKTEEFFTNISVGSLSAIPRWRFARVLEVKAGDSHSPRLGNALGAFYLSTCEIAQGKNLLVEHIINRETHHGVLRMVLFGSIMRAYLYLAEKSDRA